MSEPLDGRRYVPTLRALLERADEQIVELTAPKPGYYRGAPPPGALVSPGAVIGELEVLGVLHRLVAPPRAHGVVTRPAEAQRLARRPVGYGGLLLRLDKEQAIAAGGAVNEEENGESGGGPVFKSPLGGRYYARPAPDADPFVTVGQALTEGTTVAIVEVMKTFNRVQYDGPPAKIARIVPGDGEDIEAGDPLLELETTG